MRVVQELSDALQRETQPLARARLELRLAVIAARQGRFDDSLATVARVRAGLAAAAAADAETTAWLSLVEGLVALHQAPDAASTDRLTRAVVLARLAPGTQVQALATAWLAHLHFNQGRLAEFAALARAALDLSASGVAPAVGATPAAASAPVAAGVAAPGWPAVQARVLLTVASAWMSAGMPARAQPWFFAAREAAAAEGDSLMVGAVLHDMAAFRVHALRIEWARHAVGRRETAPSAEDDLARVLLDSAHSYEQAVHAGALAPLQPLARIALQVVRGEHEAALELAARTLPQLVEAGLCRYDALLRADRLWCTLASGRRADAAAHSAESADILARLVQHTPDPDDRLIVHATLAQAWRAAGQAQAAAHHAACAASEDDRLRRAQAELGARLQENRLVQPPAGGTRGPQPGAPAGD
ncbi:MAG: hypothetical protein RI988_2257 [Pseudomonadota bacterium]|jgi:hypothetical protein